MTEQEQIEADIEDAIHNHLGSHVEYVEFDADTTDGDTVLTEVRISDIAARLGPALHAAGYRKIPDEPTDEMVELSEDAIHNHLHQFIAASDPGDGTEHVLDDIPVGEVVDVVSAAVLDVLRGGDGA